MFERCAGRMGVSSSEALDPELFAKDVLSMLER
jgi:hypothetical protein